jgi:hypothetical protein
MISIEQQQKNVETLYRDWAKILHLCGSGDRRTESMFGAWLDAAASLEMRKGAENGSN